MVGTVILMILCIICVLLMLPVRVKASFGDGKWSVAVYYVFIRVFHKESKEKPKYEKPPKPEDVPEGEKPPQETVTPAEPKPVQSDAKPEPAKPESIPKPEAVTETPKPEPSAEIAEDDDDPFLDDGYEPEKKKKRRKKPKKNADDVTEDAEPDEKPKKRGFIERIKPHSLSDWMGLIQDGLAALSPALKFLTRHLHFRHIRLYLAVATDDPANTATLYGKICAAAYNLLGALQCWVDIETDEFRILADFYNDKITFRAAAELRVSPMAAIFLVLILGIKFLWRTVCRFRREDKEAKLKAKETAPIPQTESI